MRWIIAVALMLPMLAGCGPLAVGAGLNELFKKATEDLLEPRIVELYVVDPGGGDPFPAPAYASSGVIEFEVEANKKVSVLGSLVGPSEMEDRLCTIKQIDDGDTRDCIDSDEFRELNEETSVVTRFSVLAFEDKLLANDTLADGDWVLFLRIRDADGRTHELVHRFTVDKTLPEAPVLVAVEALVPHAIDVTWIPSIDPVSTENVNADPSGIVGYNIHYREGGIEVPNPGFEPGEEVVFVNGADLSTYRLTDLCAGRQHSITVAAVDAAGRAGQTTEPTESERSKALEIRTRIGGDGTFTALAAQLVAEGAFDIDVADFDDDGIQDLVVVAPGGLQVLRGKAVAPRRGGGEFVGGDFKAPPSHMAEFRAAVIRDFNGDEIDDIVAVGTGNTGSAIATYFGVSEDAARGTFTDPGEQDQLDLPGTPNGLVAGTPGTGGATRLSLATTGPLLDLVRAPGDPGHFSARALSFTFAGPSCSLLVDHDGTTGDDLSFCIGNELRTVLGPDFASQSGRQAVASAGGTAIGMVSGFFNEDAFPDLAIAHDTGSIAIVLGDGPLADPTAGQIPGTTPGSQTGLIQFQEPDVLSLTTGPASMATGDFDSDGVTDIAVAVYSAVEEGSIVKILFGNRDANGLADGTFSIGSPLQVGRGLTAIATGDFDNDGVTDLAVTSDVGLIHILIGNGVTARGNGTFSRPEQTGVGGQSGLFLEGVTDANRDGIDDLYGIRGLLRVLHGSGFAGQGDGKFGFGRSNFWHLGVHRMTSDDLDGDGWPDFIGHNSNSDGGRGHIETHKPSGSGFLRSFGFVPFPEEEGLCAGTPDTPAPIAADFNGDGVPDLAVSRGGVAAIIYGKLEGGLTNLPGPRVQSQTPELAEDDFVVDDEVIRIFNPGHCSAALAVGRFDPGPDPDLASLDLTTGQLQIITRTDIKDTLVIPVGPVSVEMPDGVDELDDGAGATASVIVRGTATARISFELSVNLRDVGDEARITIYRIPFQWPYVQTENIPIPPNRVFPDPPADDVADALDAGEVAMFATELTVADVDGKDWATLEIPIVVENKVRGQAFYLFVHNESGDVLDINYLHQKGLPDYVPAVPIETGIHMATDGSTPPIPGGVGRLQLMVAEDLNLDGVTDIVLLHPATKKAAVLIGKRTQAPNSVEFDDPRVTDFSMDSTGAALIEGTPIAIRTADVNADGVPDLIGLATNPAQIVVFVGDVDAAGRATGTFTEALAPKTIPDVQVATSLVVGDFNSDGIPDLAVGTAGDPVILLGQGQLTKDEDVGEPGEDDDDDD